jgi:RNA polymerase sigma-70 factor (ECF subfamily)
VFQDLRKPVYRYVLGLLGSEPEAEEVTQDAFLAFYRELSRGNRVEEARPWIFRVAHNTAIDRIRKRGHEEHLDVHAWWELEIPDKDLRTRVEERIQKDQERVLLARAIGSLAPQQRRCLELRVEGLTYREIAATLGIGVSSVQNHLTRAIRKLHLELRG